MSNRIKDAKATFIGLQREVGFGFKSGNKVDGCVYTCETNWTGDLCDVSLCSYISRDIARLFKGAGGSNACPDDQVVGREVRSV